MRSLLISMVLVLAVACSKDKGGGGGGGGGPAATAPTKELAVSTLKAVDAALEAKDFAKAATMFGVPAGASREDLAKQLDGLVEKQEISGPGIEILAAKGTWGKITEVFPDKGERWAQKFGVPAADCYGLGYEQGEAAFHWTGKSLELIRLDDIGKLAP